MPTISRNLTGTNRTIGNCGRDWIVIHNVGTAPTYEGAAYANTQYFAGGYRGASAHYFIDDGDVIWQSVDEADTAWAVGDATSRNGCLNSNSISIEVCGDGVFGGNRRTNLRWLVHQLMVRHGIDAAHVVRHYDVTGKQCPAYYAGANNQAWHELRNYITNNGEDDDMTPEQAQQLSEVHNRLTRTDNQGHPTKQGHDMLGRINMIEHTLERTDTAGHDNPAGHDLYGRVQIIERDVREMHELLVKISKKL